MNIRYAIRISGLSLLLVAAAMVPVAVFAVAEGSDEGWATAEALGGTVLLVVLGYTAVRLVFPPHSVHFGRREAFLMVGVTWLVAPVLTGLPYFLWATLFSPFSADPHPFASPINCYFEAMSGLTTTGASILNDIEAVPRGLLLWRSTTHWLGGLGIVLLFVAVLPTVGATGRKLHLVESTGPSPSEVRPRIRDTARVLWMSYSVITVASVIALRFAGLPWFNAVCETFGAVATGGFSVRNQSIDAYGSGVVESIIILVMLLGAINFAVYFDLVHRRGRHARRDPELRLFLALIVLGSVVVVVAVHGAEIVTMSGSQRHADWATALRYGIFNLISMHTDTGFATADFDRWPSLAMAGIVLGTFIGGSAGSTTGGIKVVRLLAGAKIMLHRVRRFTNPTEVMPVRIGDRTLDREEQTAVILTILLFMAALIIGTFLLMLIGAPEGGMDVTTAFSASLANLCTAGPGFGGVGPVQNYLWIPDVGKLVLCGLMLIGRLEIVPVLVLFDLRFWRSR